MALNNENNNECCKCTTPEYEIILNQQGPQGRQGEKGNDGFSPTVTVHTNTDQVYSLTITTADGQITTPNLKASVPGTGTAGQVLTKNSDTPYDMSFQSLPQAQDNQAGIVQLATENDLEPDSEGEVDSTKAVTPDLLSTYVEQEINNADDKYVTLDTEQQITGKKTFSFNDGIFANSIKEINQGSTLITYNQDASNILIGSTGASTSNITLRTKQDGQLLYQKGPNNSLQIITSGDIATTSKAGIVKPDGTSITVDADGTIHSVGGTGGTSDYTDLTNKPQINGHELTGNQDGNALGLANQSDLANYVDLTTNDQVITGIKIFQNAISIDNPVTPGEYGSTMFGANHISYASTNPEYQFFQLRPDQDNSHELRIGNTNAKWNSVNINTNGLYLNGQPILSGTNLSDYLIAGSNITLSPDNEGRITISSTGGGEVPGNVLTSDNISQDAYIQQLEQRIAALEASIDGGNAETNGTIQYVSQIIDIDPSVSNVGTVGKDTVTIQDGEV